MARSGQPGYEDGHQDCTEHHQHGQNYHQDGIDGHQICQNGKKDACQVGLDGNKLTR